MKKIQSPTTHYRAILETYGDIVLCEEPHLDLDDNLFMAYLYDCNNVRAMTGSGSSVEMAIENLYDATRWGLGMHIEVSPWLHPEEDNN